MVANQRYMLSDSAETALAEISRWRQDHVVTLQSEQFTSGRHVAEVLERRHRSALSGVVSCAEVFTTDLLRDLRPEVTDSEISTWQKREKAWREHLDVKFVDLPTRAALRGFVEARNAIQHGLGALTNTQLGISANRPREYNRRDETLTWLRVAKIRLDAGRVVIDKDDVDRCLTTIKAFIHDLDAQAYTAHRGQTAT